ncbi:MAG: AmmeMemoRadiSam system protein B [Candidatus Gastranaerophilaceae bacterium]
MKNIRPTSAAGKFYTDDKDELLNQLELLKKSNVHDYDCQTRAIIVPHAGYRYSGQLASEGFQYLDKNVKNVFIIAPPHYVAVKNVALSSFAKWSTPLGEIEVNQEINQELAEKFGCEFEDDAFVDEHSIEVQIPFLQNVLPKVKIIPILAGNHYEKITKIIEHYWQNPKNAFIVSSDLSHFYETNEAKKIDSVTAEMIETNNVEQFNPNRACGAVGVCALVEFVKIKNYSLIRVGMVNSGDITGDGSRVVGYGSWLLHEGKKNEFIKKHFSRFVIDACKKSIMAEFEGEKFPKFEKIPAVFEESGACFVTLEKNGNLRGCIGSIIAHQPLIIDLVKNAQNSAFSDTRFPPLKKDEFEDLAIDVSLLSAPEQMHFENEQDLLNQIKPFTDGIIIKDGSYQAVYLPSVWEQLPEKALFLNSLKIKAGMPPKHFSDAFEAYRFTTEYIRS